MAWNLHLFDARSDGLGGATLVASVLTSTAAHMSYRVRHGQPTAIPAAFVLLLAAMSSAAMPLVSDPMPASVHVSTAGAMLCMVFVLLRWPRWQPGWALASAAALLATSMVRGAIESDWAIIGDYLVLGGAASVFVGCLHLVAFGLHGSRFRRRLGARVMGISFLALGLLLFGLGNLERYRALGQRREALACLCLAFTTMVVANTLMRIRHQAPS
jgi:hypothetical protein